MGISLSAINSWRLHKGLRKVIRQFERWFPVLNIDIEDIVVGFTVIFNLEHALAYAVASNEKLTFSLPLPTESTTVPTLIQTPSPFQSLALIQ